MPVATATGGVFNATVRDQAGAGRGGHKPLTLLWLPEAKKGGASGTTLFLVNSER